eukprot:TRINITY_DN539_c0_g1_i1.p1 TRINITY_DN539_c0_g1~~TRINITY_DN539_c0_g1_i1.p1  ORF type:complete len:311 (-),score=86.64 TRINITY_DN539_c0_g1_i1:67-948(-)
MDTHAQQMLGRFHEHASLALHHAVQALCVANDLDAESSRLVARLCEKTMLPSSYLEAELASVADDPTVSEMRAVVDEFGSPSGALVLPNAGEEGTEVDDEILQKGVNSVSSAPQSQPRGRKSHSSLSRRSKDTTAPTTPQTPSAPFPSVVAPSTSSPSSTPAAALSSVPPSSPPSYFGGISSLPPLPTESLKGRIPTPSEIAPLPDMHVQDIPIFPPPVLTVEEAEIVNMWKARPLEEIIAEKERLLVQMSALTTQGVTTTDTMGTLLLREHAVHIQKQIISLLEALREKVKT